jgi:hypothetical protein
MIKEAAVKLKKKTSTVYHHRKRNKLEAARIEYNGFPFPHEYSGEGRGANSFVSIIMYLTCTIIVLLKK